MTVLASQGDWSGDKGERKAKKSERGSEEFLRTGEVDAKSNK